MSENHNYCGSDDCRICYPGNSTRHKCMLIDREICEANEARAERKTQAEEEIHRAVDSILGVPASDFTVSLSDDKFARSVLQEADHLISGARQEDYGNPKQTTTDIAFQWATYILQKYEIHVPLEGEDVCWMMTDLKKIRQMKKKKRDNLVDAAGYIGLVEKVGG